ncbi:hypothetical protein Hanom_Chr08g00685501 [Helianthus anomalus]
MTCSGQHKDGQCNILNIIQNLNKTTYNLRQSYVANQRLSLSRQTWMKGCPTSDPLSFSTMWKHTVRNLKPFFS